MCPSSSTESSRCERRLAEAVAQSSINEARWLSFESCCGLFRRQNGSAQGLRCQWLGTLSSRIGSNVMAGLQGWIDQKQSCEFCSDCFRCSTNLVFVIGHSDLGLGAPQLHQAGQSGNMRSFPFISPLNSKVTMYDACTDSSS